MKISHEKPPIYDDIVNAGMNPSDLAVFTIGDTIFNPSGQDLPADLIAHEEHHMKQQGDDVDYWWSRYLDDQFFRINQEAEAYGIQYRFVCKTVKDRNQRSRVLYFFAEVLAGPTYGNVISTEAAAKMIKKVANVS